MRWHQSQMLLQNILAGIFFFFSIFYFKYTYIFLFSFPFSQGFKKKKRIITLLHLMKMREPRRYQNEKLIKGKIVPVFVLNGIFCSLNHFIHLISFRFVDWAKKHSLFESRFFFIIIRNNLYLMNFSGLVTEDRWMEQISHNS